MPNLDEARQRLVRRFGDDVQSWLEELPGRLLVLKDRWALELEGVLPKGSMSVVIPCRTARGERAILKICPDRSRMATEIAALAHWSTPHVPTVLQTDPSMGVLMEQLEPGTPLQESGTYPAISDLAQLLTALHMQSTRAPDLAFPSVAERVDYLFASCKPWRDSNATLVGLVPPELFDRGRRSALRLAAEPSSTVLLHGDFTPVNILDGGDQRGLVAIDPAPCLGDPAFDPVDLVFWQAADLDTIIRRVEVLAPAIGVAAARLLDWCTAFAGMAAMDLVGPGQRTEPPDEDRSARVSAALSLAARTPS